MVRDSRVSNYSAAAAVPQGKKEKKALVCCHLHGTGDQVCKAPKVPDSHFCSAHSCPKCNNDKSSAVLFCRNCEAGNVKAKGGNAKYEDQQLKVLLKSGAVTQAEYDKRMQAMKEKKKKMHKKSNHPATTEGIDTDALKAVQNNEIELVYKFTFDYEKKKWERTMAAVTIETEHFAEGAMRFAYHMTDWTRPDRRFVAKASREQEKERTYFVDVQMQEMCTFFAQEFNLRGPPKRVKFVEAFLIERFSLPEKDEHRVMACEPFMEGEYSKFNNNYGWQSPDDRNTPQAFSHFSSYHSNGEYVVVDVQGVGDCYTDPQIHSKDGRGFGKGNVGSEGIDKFFSTHRCNSICKMLGLTDKIQDFQGTAEKKYVPEHLDYESPPTDEDLAFFNLELERYQEIMRMFRAADSDGSGELSLAELPGLCAKMGVEIPTSQLMNVLVHVDRDGSGEISLLEFLFWWTGYEP